MGSQQPPVLSVVVAIVSDTTDPRVDVSHLAGCLEALRDQAGAPSMEVIVPYHDGVDGVEGLRRQFPEVTFLPVGDLKAAGGSREHHDAIRARGIAAAQGGLIALLEDHGRPDRAWSANIVRAHEQSYSAIGGAIENGVDRPLNWGVYFCDFWRYQNPLPSGESTFASDANTSYKRSAMESIRPLWEQSFREVVVNGELISRGGKVALQPDIVVYQHRSNLRPGAALRERFIWGRSYATTRNRLLSVPRRIAYAILSPSLPAVLLFRMADIAWKRRRHLGKFLGSVLWIGALLASWSLGEGFGYLTGASSRSRSRGVFP